MYMYMYTLRYLYIHVCTGFGNLHLKGMYVH